MSRSLSAGGGSDGGRGGGSTHDGSANETLTALSGFRVGHWTHASARTGCTVVVCPPGNVASGSVRGHAPGTRETALLEPSRSVPGVDAIVLAGGSAFGLAAADGAVAWLERAGRGFPTPFGRVPIVPAAVLFDGGAGRFDVRPDADAGDAACRDASDAPVVMGSVGAGTGATVGKLLGFDKAERSGLGSALLRVGAARVAALAVSNAIGNIVDPNSGERVAGVRVDDYEDLAGRIEAPLGSNTTLVMVATDARLDKATCRQLAEAAHVGIARVTRPSHTAADGDTAFVVASGDVDPPPSATALGVATQEVVARALLRGVRAAQASGGGAGNEGQR